jgi:hypothetical protein
VKTRCSDAATLLACWVTPWMTLSHRIVSVRSSLTRSRNSPVAVVLESGRVLPGENTGTRGFRRSSTELSRTMLSTCCSV